MPFSLLAKLQISLHSKVFARRLSIKKCRCEDLVKRLLGEPGYYSVRGRPRVGWDADFALVLLCDSPTFYSDRLPDRFIMSRSLSSAFCQQSLDQLS